MRGAGEMVNARLRQRLAGARVLVVEDEPNSREMMRMLLAGAGIAVDTACDGREAVEMAAVTPYAAVLMDMEMPVMDGLEATRSIRRLPGGGRLPIIALTGTVLASARAGCLEAGMDAVAGKPVDPPRLFRTLLECLGETGPVASEAQPGSMPGVVPGSAAAPQPPERVAYPGLHLQAGLARWGDPQKYAEFLRLFTVEYGDAVERMRQAPADQAARQAHRLKGAAANLALEELAASAAVAEESLAAARPAAKALADLEAALGTALASIAKLLP